MNEISAYYDLYIILVSTIKNETKKKVYNFLISYFDVLL